MDAPTATPKTIMNITGPVEYPAMTRKIDVITVVKKMHLRGPIFVTARPTRGMIKQNRVRMENALLTMPASHPSTPDETFSFTLTGENDAPMPSGNGASLTVNGTGTDVNAQFLFRVGVSEITGEYIGVTFQNGSAVVGLKTGESITISGLPAGASYAVTELNSGDYTVSASTPKAACPPTASPS